MIFLLWLVCLQEAIDKKPITNGYSHRNFRGERLLKTIDAIGSTEAAWNFIVEEAEHKDLLGFRTENISAFQLLAYRAQAERYRRIGRDPSRLERQIKKLKAAEQRKANEAHDIAARHQREADDAATGRIERAGFEIIDMPVWKFENEVVSLLDRKWSGDRTVFVRLTCGDERISRKITPDYLEYQQLLAAIEPLTKRSVQ